MSMETYIFTKKEKIPTKKALQIAIKEAGFDYTLDEKFDPLSTEFTFHMGSFEGLESGCDYVVEEYDAEEWEFEDVDKAKIGDADTTIVLGTFSNAQEIVAMMCISSVLSNMMEAPMISDFFSEEIIAPNETIALAKEIIEDSRKQFKGPSTTREAVLNYGPKDTEDLNINFEALQKELQDEVDKTFAEHGEASEEKKGFFGGLLSRLKTLGGDIKEGLGHTDGYETGEDFTKEVRTSLEEAGISLDKPLDLAYYLYFKDEQSAKGADLELAALGLKRYIEKKGKKEWLCYSAKNMIPSKEELMLIGDKMIQLCEHYNGDFDGWETVPEYGFNPFADEADKDECMTMAQNILNDTKNMYNPPHVYIEADLEKFALLDMDGYSTQEKELEALGFHFLGNLENKTMSETGNIVTFSRIMYHAEAKIIGAFYYFDMMDTFFIEFSSKLEDDTLIITSNTFSSGGIDPDNFDVSYIVSATAEELLDNHMQRVRKYSSKAMDLGSIDKYIKMENEALQSKYDKLASIGWVTKEQLMKLGSGNEAIVECVYEAIQKILASSDGV